MNYAQAIKRIITGTLFGVIGTLLFIGMPYTFVGILIQLLLIILLFEWPRFARYSVAWWLFAFIYPVFPWICMVKLALGVESRILLALVYATVFAFDTGAWAVGTLIGSTPLASGISPRKTWEGFIGGVMSIFGVLLLTRWCPLFAWQPLWFLVISAFLIGIVATMGDLFESMLKRKAHLKDSGFILPGHGGLLDRFDGVLFVVPLVFIAQSWLKPLMLMVPFLN